MRIHNTRPEDSGNYTCKAWAGPVTKTSNAVEFTTNLATPTPVVILANGNSGTEYESVILLQ